jgi:hypothetical protein
MIIIKTAVIKKVTLKVITDQIIRKNLLAADQDPVVQAVSQENPVSHSPMEVKENQLHRANQKTANQKTANLTGIIALLQRKNKFKHNELEHLKTAVLLHHPLAKLQWETVADQGAHQLKSTDQKLHLLKHQLL